MALPTYSLPLCGSLKPLDFDDRDHADVDPRGLIKLWEPPKANARYVMGVDPTAGLLDWDRAMRNADDMKTDNGVIEIIRVGSHDVPDVQVAEFAAPIDPEDLADVAALMGRLYCGNSEFGEALAIIEIWPGPGILTQRRLINNFAYSNFFRWEYLDSIVPSATNTLGWTSNNKTLQMLWSRFARHLRRGRLIVRSPWLVDELADLQNLPGKIFPQPSGEMAHDDRVRAIATAVWAAHDWSLGEEAPGEPRAIEKGDHPINWQAQDCSSEEMLEMWEEKFQDILNS